MAMNYGLAFTQIGRHYGRNKLFKFIGLFLRSLQLLPFAIRERPSLALNHGSRTQTLVCNALGIPTVTIMDYEFAAELFFLRPLWEIVPEIIPASSATCRRHGGILKYPGIKEDVYVPDFRPDSSILKHLALEGSSIIVTVRPPATEAHYHNPEAEILFEHFMDRVCATPGTKTVLLPRNKRQEEEIRSKWWRWFAGSKVVIPSGVVEGLNLLWHSDLVVSGGGTMNREAAALGVPVYSIFRGKIGAVDRQLEAEGRLVLIESVSDVTNKILLEPRRKSSAMDEKPRRALDQIVRHVEGLAQANSAPSGRRIVDYVPS
jgi:predicted glycosyltransferase